MHIFPGGGGGGGYDRGGTGCRNCFIRHFACMLLCLFFAFTFPAGSRVARKLDPLLLLEDVGLVQMMCAPEASDTMRCVP